VAQIAHKQLVIHCIFLLFCVRQATALHYGKRTITIHNLTGGTHKPGRWVNGRLQFALFPRIMQAQNG
jgi:hypothetical protein